MSDVAIPGRTYSKASISLTLHCYHRVAAEQANAHWRENLHPPLPGT